MVVSLLEPATLIFLPLKFKFSVYVPSATDTLSPFEEKLIPACMDLNGLSNEPVASISFPLSLIYQLGPL